MSQRPCCGGTNTEELPCCLSQAKLASLQQQLQQRDATILALRQEMGAMAGHMAAEAAAADAQLAAAVAGQQAEAEAASQRQLAFIDRLLADKDSLAQQVSRQCGCWCCARLAHALAMHADACSTHTHTHTGAILLEEEGALTHHMG